MSNLTPIQEELTAEEIFNLLLDSKNKSLTLRIPTLQSHRIKSALSTYKHSKGRKNPRFPRGSRFKYSEERIGPNITELNISIVPPTKFSAQVLPN